jgi:uncharacterized cupredoxin-like copper-binding protein
MRARVLFALAIAAVALVAACGGGGKSPSKVSAALEEWEITPQPAEVRPGKVDFTVVNNGTKVHQFIVVKSDLPPGQLPMTAGNSVDLAKLNVSGSIEAIEPGASANVELELFPGKYVFICNLVTQNASGPADPHYLNGMAAGFFVLDE